MDILTELKTLTEIKSVNFAKIDSSHKNYQILTDRDKKDLIFLYLAKQIGADLLVTLDKDLLDLKKHEKTLIVRPDIAWAKVKNLFSS